MKFIALFVMITFTLPAFATEDLTTTEEVTTETFTEKVTEQLEQTSTRRAAMKYFVLANYSPLDLIIPNKYGVTAGLIHEANQTWELEYMKGSIAAPWVLKDLGSMSDQRLTLIGRSYGARNSFNFSYGVSYTNFSIHLGSKIMNRMTGNNYPSLDLLEIQSLGAHVGIGNRWTFTRNITLGVDWLTWTQPLLTIKKKSDFLSEGSNQNDRDDAGKAMSIATYFPRFAAIKIQLGILF